MLTLSVFLTACPSLRSAMSFTRVLLLNCCVCLPCDCVVVCVCVESEREENADVRKKEGVNRRVQGNWNEV